MSHWVCRVFHSSIGKKYIMAVTGLFWCGFLVAHLAGNFLLFAGEEAFMHYADTLAANKGLMYSAEILMIVVLFTHISTALKLASENNAARPEPYAYKSAPVDASLASRTMLQTGLVTLVFLVLHICTFKFGVQPGQNLYQNVTHRFASAPYALFYVLAVILLGIHVSHGLWSASQTFGFSHSKYSCVIKKLSIAFGIFIAMGFSSIALYFLMRGEHL